MTIKLKMNTNVRLGVELILTNEVNPIIDVGNTRYLIDISNWELGSIRWTPFDIQNQIIVGDKSYTVPYASHNIFRETILGPSSQLYAMNAITTEFPNFPVPEDSPGNVYP